MKKTILSLAFVLFAGVAFGQSSSYLKQNIANQVNELLLSCVDSTQIVNVDKLGTINIMSKIKDENIDFNILDLSDMEVVDPGDVQPQLCVVFTCKHCMHLTSLSADQRAHFENSTIVVPIRYKAIGLKVITKLEELQKQNR